jgi:hypothetical protein
MFDTASHPVKDFPGVPEGDTLSVRLSHMVCIHATNNTHAHNHAHSLIHVCMYCINMLRYTTHTPTHTHTHTQIYKSIPFVRPRDFLVLATLKAHDGDNGRVISAQSIVDDALVPPRRSHIRGRIHGGGYYIERLLDAPHSSRVTFIGHCDIGGSIPLFLQKLVGQRQPLQLAALRKMIEARNAE